MKPYIIFFAVTILIVQTCRGQATDTVHLSNLDFFLMDYSEKSLSLAVVPQPDPYGEVALTFGEHQGSIGICGGDPANLFSIGSEFGWGENNGKFILGPKISYEYGFIFVGRFSVIYYTDFEKGDLRLTPEVGLSFGAFGVYYGYNFNVTKNKLDIANDKLSARVSF